MRPRTAFLLGLTIDHLTRLALILLGRRYATALLRRHEVRLTNGHEALTQDINNWFPVIVDADGNEYHGRPM